MKNTIKVKRLTALEANFINTVHIVFVEILLYFNLLKGSTLLIRLFFNIASNRERTYELLAF